MYKFTGIFLSLILSYLTESAFSQQLIQKKPENIKVIADSNGHDQAKRLSTSAKLFLKNLNRITHPAARLDESGLLKRFPVKKINDTPYIGALVKTNPLLDRSALQNLGIITGSNIRDLFSMKIPLSQLESLSFLEGIEYIDIDHTIKVKLDSARSASNVDQVHAGLDLPRGYTGNDVIIGIIDNNFDYTHPVFFDSSGNTLRISRVWDQNDETGTPPEAEEFDYGTELIGQDEILNALYSNNESSHGTHVAGIAGGTGIPTDGQYGGVGSNAELVFVEFAVGRSDISDAISYILDYARGVNKPAVVNLSLGSHIGPHDGTSNFDLSIDQFSESGIIVGAAGNEGSTPLHINHTFNDDTVKSFVHFDSDVEGAEDSHEYTGEGMIDIWGDPNSSIVAAVNIYRVSDGTVFAFTDYISSESGSVLDTVFEYNSYTIEVEIATETSNPNNEKPNVQIFISNPGPDLISAIELIGNDNQIHVWNNGTGTGAALTNDFAGQGPVSSFISGNTNYTVGEIGGTSMRIITAGAFTSKNEYEDYFGNTYTISPFTEMGELAPFSSHGPTVDGRTKPEITAPGYVVASSVNSFDENLTPDNSTQVVDGISDGSREWYFAVLQGTSMSAPMVTGIIAILLETYPELSPEQAKDILMTSAITDTYTGTITNEGSNSWGWGKTNALGSVETLLNKLPEKPEIMAEGDLSFCEGDSVVLTATQATGYLWSTGDSTRTIAAKEDGGYSVRIINDEGFFSKPADTVQVIVHGLPEVEITIKRETASTGSDSVLLSVIEDESFSYQWFRDEVSLPDTSSVIIIETLGTYSVIVTTEHACSASDTLRVYALALENPDTPDLKIYPNPTSGLLIMESSLSGPSEVRIIDMNGRIIHRDKLYLTGNDHLNISAARKGQFILYLQNKGNRYVTKIRID